MLKAIMAGGCIPHRLGLSDSVLVFAQHRAFLGRTHAASVGGPAARAQPERKIAVEAEDTDEAIRLAAAGVDSVQLDKLAPEQVSEVVRGIAGLPRRPMISAAGGIHEGNARAYAAAGADLLVTSAAYAAPPADVSVTVVAETKVGAGLWRHSRKAGGEGTFHRRAGGAAGVASQRRRSRNPLRLPRPPVGWLRWAGRCCPSASISRGRRLGPGKVALLEAIGGKGRSARRRAASACPIAGPGRWWRR